LVRSAVAAGIPAEQIIQDGFIQAMDQVGKSFAANAIFVPEMMVSAMAMKEGLDLVKPMLQGTGAFSHGRVMLATVKGDLHDIGKNIVGMMLEGAGFEVIDLGINIDCAVILRKVREAQPKVLGLSALLTTTMPEMGRVIQELHADGQRTQVRVMVGGAPLSAKFAAEIGADGYAADAATAVDLCRKLAAAT
jgi:5-methyltetrahydrofolate--homocysteine methyltransferase